MKFQYWNNLKISQNSLEYVNSTGRYISDILVIILFSFCASSTCINFSSDDLNWHVRWFFRIEKILLWIQHLPYNRLSDIYKILVWNNDLPNIVLSCSSGTLKFTKL